MNGFLLVLFVLVTLVALWVVMAYNSFVRLRKKVEEAWRGVEIQLACRHELVPGIVDAAKDHAADEIPLLSELTEARTQAMSTFSPAARPAAEARLSRAFDAVRVFAEQHPELQASESFGRACGQLDELEDQIQVLRRGYNSNVSAYNTVIEMFPNSMVAGKSFTTREPFMLDSRADRARPVVAFG